MATKKFYGTTTTLAADWATASNELAFSETAPSSGSSTEQVRKGTTETTHAWSSASDTPGWVSWDAETGYPNVSLDLSAFPSGLSLSNSNENVVYAAYSDLTSFDDSVTLTNWSSTTGTGIKTRSYSSGAFDTLVGTGNRVGFAISVVNGDTKNSLDATVDFSSNDTWVEVSGTAPAPYLSLVCGAECQIHNVGNASGADSHWSVRTAGNSSTPDISSSVYRSGAHSLYFSSNTTGGLSYLQHDAGTDSAYGYFRGYFRVPDTTPTNETTIVAFDTPGTNCGLVITTGGSLRAYLHHASTPTYSSTNDVTLSANTWYGVEAELDTSGTQWVMKWRTWTESGGWTTSETVTGSTQSADVIQSGKVWVGVCTDAGEADWVIYWDDIALATTYYTAGDFYDATGTNGVSGKVLRLDPTSDGTHSFSTTGDFQHTGPTDAASSDTDLWSYLDTADIEASTDYIRQTLGASTSEYVEVHFGDESTEDDPRGVSLVSHISNPASLSDVGKLDVSDNGTDWTTVFPQETIPVGEQDHYRQAAIKVVPSDGLAWARTDVNNLRARLYGASEITIDHEALALEVEWTGEDLSSRSGTASVSNSSAATASGKSGRSDTASASNTSATTATGRTERQGTASVSHTSATTATGTKAESKSGTAAASHTSSVTATGQSARSDSASATHASSTTATGDKLEVRSGTASASHTSSVTAVGQAGKDGTASASHASSVTTAGSTGRQGTAAVSNTSATSASGSTAEARSGTASATHASSITVTGRTERQGTASESNTSSITVTGVKAEDRTGTATVSHTSSVTVTGRTERQDSASVSHTSSAVATGTAAEARSGSASASHSSAVTASGQKGGQGAASDSASSSITVTTLGAHSGTAQASHSSATTALGTTAEARQGSATVSHVSSTTATGDKLEVRSGTASASHASSVTAQGQAGKSGTASASHTVAVTAQGRTERYGTATDSWASGVTATGTASEGRSGAASASHASSITVTGSHAGSGTAQASHASATSALGTKSEAGGGTAHATHASSTSAQGTKNLSGAATTVTHSSATAAQGYKGGEGQAALAVASGVTSDGSGGHAGTAVLAVASAVAVQVQTERYGTASLAYTSGVTASGLANIVTLPPQAKADFGRGNRAGFGRGSRASFGRDSRADLED